MRHTATVPKGFIRYHVLESLAAKPMSGSEIMDDVQKRTNGCWKPSPGSIYPLLAWLQDNVYVKEFPTDQGGMKRYELTEKGKQLLEEQRKFRTKFKKEARLFMPPFVGPLWFRIPPEKTVEVRESLRRVMNAFFDLGTSLGEKYSEGALDEIREILNDTAGRLEELSGKLKG